MNWKPGDRLTHRYNPELGPGIIKDVVDRSVVVQFPESGTVLRLAATSDAIQPLVWRAGDRALMLDTEESVVVAEQLEDGTVKLDDDREVDPRGLWPEDVGESLFDRLAVGKTDSLGSFALRLDSLHLAALREADGLGSFLGGRIRLFPHQLYAAERATQTNPVRWLLADEVGLGKTVEAFLILSHLLRTGRAERVLVVAPDTLTVQWLGELWRKIHQVFVLLDEKRLQDVETDFGSGFNPFEAYQRVVVSTELLVERPDLTRLAVEAGIDVLIVDEAHHLRRPPGHPGNAEYRAVEPIAALGLHTLLLSATPLEEDAHGFFRLLQLLRPEEFPEQDSFEERLTSGTPLPACTSSARRADIGGLPPRQLSRVDLLADDWAPVAAVEAAMRALPATNALQEKTKLRRIRRALCSGAALAAVLKPSDKKNRELATAASEADPRVAWLAEQAPVWRSNGDKTLVFVAHRESLDLIRNEMKRSARMRAGVFHEDLSVGQRDIEVAQFRIDEGPSMLISTECGGEGRNFEFCTRMVLFDLPWNPNLVEQRIGRLDRIGRSIPVEIVMFRPPNGLGAAIADLYESLGLFREPLGGLELELKRAQAAIEELALSDAEEDAAVAFAPVIETAREARHRINDAAYHELHREPFKAEMGEAILARIPEDLESEMESVIVAACEQFGLKLEAHRGVARYSVKFGSRARIDALPGVPDGANYLGSFSREEAVESENIDFYSSGHPLIEGLLAHLEDSERGRVGLLDASAGPDGGRGFGVLAIYKDGPQFEAVAFDLKGRERPEWAEHLTQGSLRSKPVKREQWVEAAGWPEMIAKMAELFRDRGRPVAVAAFRLT